MNKFFALIFFVCFLLSCRQGSDGQNDVSESHEIAVTDTSILKDQFIDGQSLAYYLNSSELDKIVEDYVQGKIEIKENEQTGNLLNTLIEKQGDLVPLYFRCFMNICEDHGKDIENYLGNFCIKLLEEKTYYCVKKLRQGSPDYFTGLVANEIYKSPDWENEINNISLRLHLNLENEAPELRKELDLFIVGLKNDIEHMSDSI